MDVATSSNKLGKNKRWIFVWNVTRTWKLGRAKMVNSTDIGQFTLKRLCCLVCYTCHRLTCTDEFSISKSKVPHLVVWFDFVHQTWRCTPRFPQFPVSIPSSSSSSSSSSTLPWSSWLVPSYLGNIQSMLMRCLSPSASFTRRTSLAVGRSRRLSIISSRAGAGIKKRKENKRKKIDYLKKENG